jgi:hypothetical protein
LRAQHWVAAQRRDSKRVEEAKAVLDINAEFDAFVEEAIQDQDESSVIVQTAPVKV